MVFCTWKAFVLTTIGPDKINLYLIFWPSRRRARTCSPTPLSSTALMLRSNTLRTWVRSTIRVVFPHLLLLYRCSHQLHHHHAEHRNHHQRRPLPKMKKICTGIRSAKPEATLNLLWHGSIREAKQLHWWRTTGHQFGANICFAKLNGLYRCTWS